MTATAGFAETGFAAAAGYERAIEMWVVRVTVARRQAAAWRQTAIGSVILALALAIALAQALSGRDSAFAHVISISETPR